jgi:hypothetical protein
MTVGPSTTRGGRSTRCATPRPKPGPWLAGRETTSDGRDAEPVERVHVGNADRFVLAIDEDGKYSQNARGVAVLGGRWLADETDAVV